MRSSLVVVGRIESRRVRVAHVGRVAPGRGRRSRPLRPIDNDVNERSQGAASRGSTGGSTGSAGRCVAGSDCGGAVKRGGQLAGLVVGIHGQQGRTSRSVRGSRNAEVY